MSMPIIAVLELGSPAMLFFALAGLTPIVLHWLSRRRHEEVSWAAMQFLLAARSIDLHAAYEIGTFFGDILSNKVLKKPSASIARLQFLGRDGA